MHVCELEHDQQNMHTVMFVKLCCGYFMFFEDKHFSP